MILAVMTLEACDLPVASIPISMRPVIGSIAALLVATYMSLTASVTCSSRTLVFNSILARASDSLMRDSNYRGVAVMVFLDIPYLRMST